MMPYHCIHTLPGAAGMDKYHAVIDHCYPAGTKAFLSTGINLQYLENLVVLLKDGIPSGRLAIYFNPSIQQGEWLIGNYECINDAQAAKFLLQEAEQYIQGKGGKKITGPMNGSTWDDYRFATTNDTSLFFTEYYRHSWYPQQFMENGFQVIARYFSGKDQVMKYQRPEVLQRKAELEKTGIVFRNIRLEHYEAELRKLYPFLLNAFETNAFYSPIDEESFVQKYLAVQPYIDPQFVLIAENTVQETIGVFFCLPDHLNQQEKGLVAKTIARKNDPALGGLGHVMGEIMYAAAHKSGVRYMVHAFMHQEGTSVGVSQKYSGVSFKQYSLYEKYI